MSTEPDLRDVCRRKLEKALSRLESAHRKCERISLSTELDDDALEAFEGLTARFARATDIFLNRYLRACILSEDPAFRGTFKDHLNQAEKQGLIDSVAPWMAIRELRNRIAHEYEEDALRDLFVAVMRETPRLLAVGGALA